MCEILPPSTASFDRIRKLAVYAGEGVAQACLAGPLGLTALPDPRLIA